MLPATTSSRRAHGHPRPITLCSSDSVSFSCKIGREVMRHPSKVVYADASSASCSISKAQRRSSQSLVKEEVAGGNPAGPAISGSVAQHLERLCYVSPSFFNARYSSGQRGRAVNPLPSGFDGSNPSLATISEVVAKCHRRALVGRVGRKSNTALMRRSRSAFRTILPHRKFLFYLIGRFTSRGSSKS